MKHSKLKFISTVGLAGLICLSTLPANAMMGRLRTDVTRMAQQARQAAALYRNSLFTKPQALTPQPLAKIAAPLKMQLPAVASATQRKINPNLLVPCVAAAAVVAATDGQNPEDGAPITTASQKSRDEQIETIKQELAVLPSPPTNEREKDDYFTYIRKKINTTDFGTLYSALTRHTQTFPQGYADDVLRVLYYEWNSKPHTLTTFVQDLNDITQLSSANEKYEYLKSFSRMLKYEENTEMLTQTLLAWFKSHSTDEQITLGMGLFAEHFLSLSEITPVLSDKVLLTIIEQPKELAELTYGFHSNSEYHLNHFFWLLKDQPVTAIKNAEKIIHVVFEQGSLKTRLLFLSQPHIYAFVKAMEPKKLQSTFDLLIQELEQLKPKEQAAEKTYTLLSLFSKTPLIQNLLLFSDPTAFAALTLFLSNEQTAMLLRDHGHTTANKKRDALSQPQGHASRIHLWSKEFAYQLATKLFEEHPTQMITPFINLLLSYLSNDLIEKWYQNFHNALSSPFGTTEGEDTCHLFQSNFTFRQLAEPLLQDSTLNFSSLVPLITEYTSQEYKEGRIVLFHGQSHKWMFLQTIWQQLKALKKGQPYDPEKVDLRFTHQPEVSPEQAAFLRNKGFNNLHHLRPHTLFANLHVFGNLYNNVGSSTWDYITNNYDQTVNRRSEVFDAALKDMFTELDMQEEYAALLAQDSDIFQTLEEQFEAAVKEQGNFGNLLVISMPPDIAEKLVYSAHPGGAMKPLTLNGKETTSVVDASKNPKDLPEANEWVIILSEEMINPEKREAAGIKIVGFDPVKYWQTSSYMAFEKEVEEKLVEPLRKMRAKKSQKNGEQS